MKHRIFATLATALVVMVCAASASAQVPDIHYFRFNEGTGTATSDLAIPGVGAAALNAASWETAVPQLGAAALKLPPAATAGTNVKTNVLTSINGSWTIEMWVRDFDNSSTLRYICGDSTAGAFRIYKTGLSPSSLVIAGTGMTALTVPGALTFQTWTHIAFAYDSSANTLTCYLNGVQAGQNTQANQLSFNGTGAAGLSIGGYATSSQWIGVIDEFRMWGSVRSAANLLANMNNQLTPFTDDLSVTAIPSPVTSNTDCANLTATETISFTVRNLGTNTIPSGTLLTAQYVLDGGTPVIEVFLTSNTLNSGDTETLTFITPADLSATGSHSVAVTATHTGDLFAGNDTFVRNVDSGGTGVVTIFPWIENFDSSPAQNSTVPPSGWVQDTADATGTDSDWYMHSGTTGSLNTGPPADHTTGTTVGYYAYVEDGGGNHAQVNLLTPCIDLSTIPNPTLIFELFSYNGNPAGGTTQENFFAVDVISYPGGIVTMDALGPIGHQPTSPTWIGSTWTTQTVNLTAFIGSTVRLRFRATSNNSGAGNTFYHDIAIDDVAVFNATVGNGQVPQAGIAVLDLNGSTNGALSTPASGQTGPYYANATPGSPLLFTLEGEPNQPMIVMVGPLNPVVASYPNIGQFDIGGPVDPQGIPTLLQVVGDGFNPFTFINALFNTGGTGTTVLSFQTPPLPAGVLGGFQAAFATNNGFFFAMSNSIELSIN